MRFLFPSEAFKFKKMEETKRNTNARSVWEEVLATRKPETGADGLPVIDWTGTPHSIDLQLYKFYGLSRREVEFIETHVREMD